MLYNPLVIALPLGIVMGDVPQAMIIGAYLQMVYIGVVSGLGGVATVDKPLATAITIPIAIATGMSPELAMAIALPFGIIGANISHLEKIIFTYFVHKADKFAESQYRCYSTLFTYRFVPLSTCLHSQYLRG